MTNIYHDDLRTPGISPRPAISLKQILHSSKSRIYPCLRPQRKQRRTTRVENFGFFSDRAITDFFAIKLFSLGCFFRLLETKSDFLIQRNSLRLIFDIARY